MTQYQGNRSELNLREGLEQTLKGMAEEGHTVESRLQWLNQFTHTLLEGIEVAYDKYKAGEDVNVILTIENDIADKLGLYTYTEIEG